MRISHPVFLALSLASSVALAQNQYREPDPTQMPLIGLADQISTQIAMDPNASGGMQSEGEQAGGDQSSGSAAEPASEGQLITAEIAHSRSVPIRDQLTLKPQTENDITYLCGGIGESEANYLKQTAARDYDLMMTFASRNGEYVADVSVAIEDGKGNQVLRTMCGGPIMLVDLPKTGTYRIHAQTAGLTLNRTVHVKVKQRANQLVFAWPREAVESAAVAETRGTQPSEGSAGSSSGASGVSGTGNSRGAAPSGEAEQ